MIPDVPCSCGDPTTVCPIHHAWPRKITVRDVLDGCTCALVNEPGWIDEPMVLINLACPVHGAEAFRKRGKEGA